MRSSPTIAFALGVSLLLTPQSEVIAGSGKHIPPIGQFARLNVRSPAETWVVIDLSYVRIAHYLARGELEPLLDEADLMRDALGWLKKHRNEVFAPMRIEAGKSALSIADDIVDSVHYSANRHRLEPSRQYFALVKEALRQVELNQAADNPLHQARRKQGRRIVMK